MKEANLEGILFKKEVFEIIVTAIEVHKELGPGFLESVYEEAMTIEATKKDISFQTQVRIPIQYKGQTLNKEFIADCIAFDKIIIEYKCIAKLTRIDEAQIINYLKATGMKVGLLINFGSVSKLEWKRFILT
jgi:GxxExxY protein